MMAYVEARATEHRYRRLDRHVVAEPGRNQKAGVGADQRMAAEIVGLEVFVLGHAERALDQRRGAGIEERHVARIVDDAGRVAVAPLDAHDARVDEHSWPP